MNHSLKRRLGLAAVLSIVMGDMMGSGIFYTPQELALVATQSWQVYFLWSLCGFIILCGALSVAEACTYYPESGSDYFIIKEGWGDGLGFLRVWTNMWVSGPGSIAAVAILFGEFFTKFSGWSTEPVTIGIVVIIFFVGINLVGVSLSSWTQILLTTIKVSALLFIVVMSIFLVDATPLLDSTLNESQHSGGGILQLFRLTGLGIGVVLFTYDGWIDIIHAAGEVKNPKKNIPAGLIIGIIGITLLYLITNYAYLRVVPLSEMGRGNQLAIFKVAEATFGMIGGKFISILLMVSILGALGGLIMTNPRLIYGMSAQLQSSGKFSLFKFLSNVNSKTGVPSGSLLFMGAISIVALIYLQSFSRIVNFFVVPNHFFNILLVAAIFKFRKKIDIKPQDYHTPFYPVTPILFIITILGFLFAAIIYRPQDTIIGILLTAIGIPFYLWLKERK